MCRHDLEGHGLDTEELAKAQKDADELFLFRRSQRPVQFGTAHAVVAVVPGVFVIGLNPVHAHGGFLSRSGGPAHRGPYIHEETRRPDFHTFLKLFLCP